MDCECQLRALCQYSGGGETFQNHRDGDERVMPLIRSQEASQLTSAQDLASYLAVQRNGAFATGETPLYIQSQAPRYHHEGEHWLDPQQTGPPNKLTHEAQHGSATALQPRPADDKPDVFKIPRAKLAAASAVASATTTTTRAILSSNARKEPFSGSTISSVPATDVQDKAKICAHPRYPGLVLAYTNCHKVGAPPDVLKQLEEIDHKYQNLIPLASHANVGQDPELDHFMDAYCDVLHKCHYELSKPFKKAMSFIRNVELQLNALSKGAGSCKGSQPEDEDGASGTRTSDDKGSCSVLDFNMENVMAEHLRTMMQQQYQEQQEEVGLSMGMGVNIEPLAEEHKIKQELMRRYKNCIGSLKQEFLKKKKKGKLPKDARDKLFNWWSQHYKWPYPSEAEKTALAETTGLDQKQINNWFINQRKRHWQPSEEMQFAMMDPARSSQHHLHQAQENVVPASTAAEWALHPFNAALHQCGDMTHDYRPTHARTLSFSQYDGVRVKPINDGSKELACSPQKHLLMWDDDG